MDKMKMETANQTLDNLAKLKEMFPEVITESKDENGEIVAAIDAKKLEQLLSTKVIDGDESYDFTWVGKKRAMIEACKPIRKTLRPCREESVDWENTQNLYIEGDNLDVLKLLQESYLNKVKMIYIDPPYNTGKDFIYNDNFIMEKDEYNDGIGFRDDNEYIQFKQNNDSNPRFHSDWCSMIYPRLKLARNLLTNDGIILISIGEQEVQNLKKICSEIFSASNYIETYIWESTFRPDNSSSVMRRNAEFVLCIAKNKTLITKLVGEIKEKEGLPSLTKTSMKESILEFPANTVKTMLSNGIYKAGKRDSYELLNDVTVKDGIITNSFKLKGHMIWGQDNLLREIEQGTEIIIKGEGFVPYTKKIGDSIMSPKKIIPNTIVGDILSANTECSELFNKKVFSYPKPVTLIKYLINYFQDKDFIVMDFFSGSATTAQAVMETNATDDGKRKFIMIQLPEDLDDNYKNATDKERSVVQNAINLCDELGQEHLLTKVAQERIRRAGKKIVEETGKKDLDIGFRVLKLADGNMKDVYYTPEEYNQKDLADMASNIKDDRTPEDLLYACMLEWGLELSLPHKVQTVAGYNVHIVDDGALVACFDDKISEDAIKQIAELQPLRAVFRDSGFAGDAARVNVGEIFKLKSPNTTIKVL